MKIHSNIQSLQGVERPVLTIGTFDGVHLGHRVIIDRLNAIAQQEGGESVLLTFHPHPRTVVGQAGDIELLTSLEERLQLLREAGLQHVIILPFTLEFSRMSALSYVRDLLVNRIGAHYVVVGYDHHFGRNREGNIQLLHELSEVYGFHVEEISAQTISEVEVSSTKVRRALSEGRMDDAQEYLGYPYFLNGTVVPGDGRGRDLGYPTANILADESAKLIPAQGVYAVRATIGQERLRGMLNIGSRPTFTESADDIRVEAHFFNIDVNLYGQQVHLEFISRIRAEQKFENSAAFLRQLEQDQKEVLSILDSTEA